MYLKISGKKQKTTVLILTADSWGSNRFLFDTKQIK